VKKLILLTLLAVVSVVQAAPTHRLKPSIVIVPQKFSSTWHDPYLLYSVYNETNTTFIAAFKDKQAAAAYSQTLVKEGDYAAYHYADYTDYPQPVTAQYSP
jgi:hypothetical protein